jgi:hypothetical protein
LIDPDDPEPLMFLPAAGDRGYKDGRVYDTGRYGFYSSSTVNGSYGLRMDFLGNGVYTTYSQHRANGFSVRCISEY